MTKPELGDYFRTKVAFPYEQYKFRLATTISGVVESGTWGLLGKEVDKPGAWWATVQDIGVINIPSLDVVDILPKEMQPPPFHDIAEWFEKHQWFKDWVPSSP